MTDAELIVGNAEICEMLGWISNKAYVYQVPNLFPSQEDSGWTEFNTQEVGFHLDWNILIGAYNQLLLKILAFTPTQKELFKDDKTMIVKFGAEHFFGLFEGQLYINSCWIKLVDFSKWYNSIKHIK